MYRVFINKFKEKLNTNIFNQIYYEMNDPILYLSVLLALGAIITTISLFEKDDDDDDGDGDNVLSIPSFEFVKAI